MTDREKGGPGVPIRREVLEEIEHDAFHRMSDVQARKTNLYAERIPLRAGEIINAGHQSIRVDRDAVVVFQDEAPLFNWSHPCRYLFYDLERMSLIHEEAAFFPPNLVNESPTFEMFHEAVRMQPSALDYFTHIGRHRIVAERKFFRGERFAVLFSGASNNRHVNDMEFLYRSLVDLYGFQSDHIYVLNYDGTLDYSGGPHPVGNWPGDGSAYRMPVHSAGTQSEFENVIDDLKARIGADDLLLIHTNNHGGHDNTGSYLCAYPWSSYPSDAYHATDFAAKLAELPRFEQLMVMMEQCHSGGFNTPVITNSTADETTIASACEELKSSRGGAHFDPFARDWIASVQGATPAGAVLNQDPDDNGDGVIGAFEAFDYADDVKDPYDTPVYSEAPVGCGIDMHLGRRDPLVILEHVHKYLKLYKEKLPGPIPPIDRSRIPVLQAYEEVLHDLEHMDRLIHEEKVMA